jgi:hypothetical protein
MFRQPKSTGAKHTHIEFITERLDKDSKTLTNRSPDSGAKNSLQNCCPTFLPSSSSPFPCSLLLHPSPFLFTLSLPAMAALLALLSCCPDRLLPCSLRPAISNSFSTALEVDGRRYAIMDDLLQRREEG